MRISSFWTFPFQDADRELYLDRLLQKLKRSGLSLYLSLTGSIADWPIETHWRILVYRITNIILCDTLDAV